MVLNISLPRWDELPGLNTSVAGRESMLSGVGLVQNLGSIHNFYDLISQSLDLYQGYHLNTSDPWIVLFPLAVELSEGMFFRNLTKQTQYKVVQVIRDNHTSDPTGFVKLSGTIPPDAADKLVIDSKYPRLQFTHARPKSYAPNTRFDNSSETNAEQTGAWQDTVTYKVLKQEPGIVSGQPFQGPKQLRPTIFTIEPDKSRPGYSIETYEQFTDSLVGFDIWALTNERADLLLKWFMEFMMRTAWVYRSHGIERIIFWQRGADVISTSFNADAVSRTLHYYVRTNELYDIFSYRNLNSLQIRVSGITIPSTGQVLPTGSNPQIIVFE